MTTAEKLTKVAEGLEKTQDLNTDLEAIINGGDTGYKSYYHEFWDKYQDNGKQTNYDCAFAGAGWTKDTFTPKYDINVSNGYMMFRAHNTYGNIYDLAEHLEKIGVRLVITGNGSTQYLFLSAKIERVPELNFSGKTMLQTFNTNAYIKTIDKIIVDENTKYNQTFDMATALENLFIEGIIGQIGFDIHWSTKLSKASITSIINALSTTTSGLTVTLSQTAVNNAFTTDEWNDLVATKTNWTIALV